MIGTDGKIGAGGKYEVEVDAKGNVQATLSYEEGAAKISTVVELDLVVLLRQAATRTENSLDDTMVNMIAGALGR